MRQALINENKDLCDKNQRYVMRITGSDAEGQAQLGNFNDPPTRKEANKMAGETHNDIWPLSKEFYFILDCDIRRRIMALQFSHDWPHGS